MAQRRMFSPKIVASDAFLDMPTSTRELYFQLGMYADDDGFINPKKIIRMIGASEDDLRVLVAKRFVLPFEDGVVVIKHWAINNLIRRDWYQPTIYSDHKKRLQTKENGVYTEKDKILVNNSLTEARLDKVNISKEEEATPAEVAKDFFSKGPSYEDHLTMFSKNSNRIFIEGEFKKFLLYWTEPNKSGTKVRWELEKTFEIKRRIMNWLSRVVQPPGQTKAKVAFS